MAHPTTRLTSAALATAAMQAERADVHTRRQLVAQETAAGHLACTDDGRVVVYS